MFTFVHLFERRSEEWAKAGFRRILVLGSRFWVVRAGDGEVLQELHLPDLPAWDGMAAAYGRLYLATLEGKLICLAAQ